MRRLPVFIFALQGFLFAEPQLAAQPLPLQVSLGDRVPKTQPSDLIANSYVWVIKDSQQQPEQQPYLWIVKDSNKQLRLLKDVNKPEDRQTGSKAKDPKKPASSEFDQIVKDTQKLEGMFTLYRNKEKGKVYLEIKPEQLNKNFLGTVTMESGIGERGIYSGLPLNDFLFYFRRVNNNLQFVVRNVNFRTSPGDPQERSLDRAFSDSVLYSLDIKSTHPQRKTLLIDLGDLLLADLPGLTPILKEFLGSPYRLESSKSSFDTVKAFPLNVEVSAIYGFSSANSQDLPPNLDTLPDSRALSIKVHYSLSQLPENNGYIPRLADDRIGYFITAYKDFSNDNFREPFVRYIHRWHLEKQDPKAPLSPPKKPIVFWIENTVPLEYRDPIREGILMWNKAFEKAGFKDAIEVRQMPDNATWSPGDVRYNTIRWINSLDGFSARGPSRVNPLTGEILDADIIVDANMLRSIKQRYRNLIEPTQSQEMGLLGQENLCNLTPIKGEGSNLGRRDASRNSKFLQLLQDQDICYGMESTMQTAMGAIALSLFHNVSPTSNEMKEYVNQYLRHLIAHEVGHTLGLRHNFHGSTLNGPEELNNTEITRTRGMVSSVMDYVPVNIAPQGTKQGDYFPANIGLYDKWAIEYGYKPSGAISSIAERRFLEQIAGQSFKPEYAYATDEDILDLDPGANLWDLSGNVLLYSQWQMDNARAMWERLNKRSPSSGDYTEMRVLFNTVLNYYFNNANLLTQYVGGQSFSRDRAGTPNGRLPFTPVPLEKQRQALTNIGKYVFAADAFNFSPQLLNQLAPSRWRHWGNPIPIFRLDYPIHENLLSQQSRVLQSLLGSDRLNRLRDIELKSKPGEALTLPELFETLQDSIWTEVQDGKPQNISSLRRSLQREHLEILLEMVLRTSSVPEDARTLAWYEMRQLRKSLDVALRKQDKLDTYTKAHLAETRDRIDKALNARLESK